MTSIFTPRAHDRQRNSTRLLRRLPNRVGRPSGGAFPSCAASVRIIGRIETSSKTSGRSPHQSLLRQNAGNLAANCVRSPVIKPMRGRSRNGNCNVDDPQCCGAGLQEPRFGQSREWAEKPPPATVARTAHPARAQCKVVARRHPPPIGGFVAAGLPRRIHQKSRREDMNDFMLPGFFHDLCHFLSPPTLSGQSLSPARY